MISATSKKQPLPIGGDKLNIPQKGQTIEGIILEISKKNIIVDIPGFGIGIVLGKELKNNPSLAKTLKLSDKISAIVTEVENEKGLVELSLNEAQQEKIWLELEKALRDQSEISVRIIQANRGGLIVNYGSVNGFLPVSQLGEKNYPKVEDGNKSQIVQKLNALVGQEMKVKVLDANFDNEKLIVSEKAKSQQEFEKLVKNYSIDQAVKCEVTAITDFGVFVKFGEHKLEGLIYISEIDWKIIGHPSDVLKVGDEVEAKILSIQNGQITLSMKALKTNPWKGIEKKIKKGDEVSGEVVKFNPFGAFVKVNELIHGLIHISEFGNQQNMRNELQLNKSYKFKVTMIDPEKQRLSLKLTKEND